MSGKNVYDERKRLEAENALLREQNQNEMLNQASERIKLDGLGIRAFIAILEGSAALVISEGHDAGSKIVSFQMPPTVSTSN